MGRWTDERAIWVPAEDGPNVARIPLSTNVGGQPFAYIDAADVEWVTRWRWHISPQEYAARHPSPRGGMKPLLHRELLGLTKGDGVVVDHRNGDRLDNRRRNLYLTTRAKNAQNLEARDTTKSRMRGVHWLSTRQQWLAKIHIEGRVYQLAMSQPNHSKAHRVQLSLENLGAIASAYRARYMPGSMDATDPGWKSFRRKYLPKGYVVRDLLLPRPKRSANANLPDGLVVDIKRRLGAGHSRRAVAAALGVPYYSVWAIDAGRTYADVSV